MMNESLSDIIANYKNDFQRIHEEEIYKWKAVKYFQDHWDIQADDFHRMLTVALGKSNNLLAAQNYFPGKMICLFAERDPAAVRNMFVDLFNEERPVAARIDAFIEKAKALLEAYSEGTWKSHYQTSNSVSVYLFFRYPEKYYIYKYQKFKSFAERIGYPDRPKHGKTESVELYFNMCDEVLQAVKRDDELLRMSRNRLSQDDYSDPSFHMLTEDVVYFGSKNETEDEPGSWQLSVWEYDPDINKQQWLELLHNPEVFTQDSLAIMKRMLDMGGEASCTQLSQKFGGASNFYNRGSSSLAKRVWRACNCNVPKREDGRSQWWPILYDGRYGDDGTFLWKLHPELASALREMDLSGIPLYFGKTVADSLQPQNYWWLNANPKIWSFSRIRIGGEQNYTLLNENGNKRRIYQNFLDARAGDLVIGYESTPVKQVVALCRISRVNDGKALYFEKLESLLSPVEYSTIKDIQELQGMEYLSNPQGSLFKLTKDEYSLLLDIIREQNPRPVAAFKPAKPYTQADFLRHVYMSYEDYTCLTSLLTRKKNIILQGAPGVGKTFMAKRLAFSMLGCEDEDKVCQIQFHQSYSYEDFIMGYKPNEAGFKLETGIFYQFCQRAENNPGSKYFFIIDEINRGNLSKVFGELLMMIESDHRGEMTTMAYNNLPFAVPDNVYIIGMMNTADRSLAMIDYALRRRFSFFEMKPAFDNEGFIRYQRSLDNSNFDDLIEVVKSLNCDIANDPSLGDGFCIGHSYFCEQEDCTDEWISQVIEYDLIPLIKEYWFDNKNKVRTWEDKLRGVLND